MRACIIQNHVGQIREISLIYVLLITNFNELKHEFNSFIFLIHLTKSSNCAALHMAEVYSTFPLSWLSELALVFLETAVNNGYVIV